MIDRSGGYWDRRWADGVIYRAGVGGAQQRHEHKTNTIYSHYSAPITNTIDPHYLVSRKTSFTRIKNINGIETLDGLYAEKSLIDFFLAWNIEK